MSIELVPALNFTELDVLALTTNRFLENVQELEHW